MDKIAIYGFGRIGCQCLKVALQDGLFVPAAIADVKDEEPLFVRINTCNILSNYSAG